MNIIYMHLRFKKIKSKLFCSGCHQHTNQTTLLTNTYCIVCFFLVCRLSKNQYEMIADETLDSLTEMFEDIPERFNCDPEYDVAYSVIILFFFLVKSSIQLKILKKISYHAVCSISRNKWSLSDSGSINNMDMFAPTFRLFSSPEHKVLRVSYCDRSLSVVRRRASSVNFFT